MNLNEQIERIKSMMGVIEESKKTIEKKPIILIGPQGAGKSTTSKALSKKLKIPLVQTDMSMIDKKYESYCKDKPGVEVKIKRHPTQGVYYDSNDEYVLCVLNKLIDEYGDKKIVLDVGATHAYINDKLADDVKDLFKISSNIFLFDVSNDEDETYEFLKKRREERDEDTTSKEQEKKIKKALRDLKKYYNKTQKISIIKSDNSSKTTEELVDEIITKLT
jgi:shikimate kinase